MCIVRADDPHASYYGSFRDVLWDLGKQRNRFEPDRLPKRLIAMSAGVALLAAPLIVGWTLLAPPAETVERQGSSYGSLRATETLKGFSESKNVLRSFAAAEDALQRLAFVRHPLQTRSRMQWVERCWETTPLGSNGITGPITATANGAELWTDDANREFLSFETRLVDDQLRTVWFELTPDGPKLDWESFVFYEPVPWLDFTSGRLGGWVPNQGEDAIRVYRVYCEVGDYYNHVYSDSDNYAVFRVDNPARAKACWAYTWRSSQTESKLRMAMKQASGTALVTLKLRCDLDGSPDQLWIEEFVSSTWVYDAE